MPKNQEVIGIKYTVSGAKAADQANKNLAKSAKSAAVAQRELNRARSAGKNLGISQRAQEQLALIKKRSAAEKLATARKLSGIKIAAAAEKAASTQRLAQIKEWSAALKVVRANESAAMKTSNAQKKASAKQDLATIRQWGKEWKAQIQIRDNALKRSAAADRAKESARKKAIREWGQLWRTQVQIREGALRRAEQLRKTREAAEKRAIREWGSLWAAQIRQRNAQLNQQGGRRQPGGRGGAAGGVARPSFGVVGKIGGLLVGVAAVKGAQDLADAYQQLRNRVALVTKSEEEREVVTARVIDIANKSRASLTATGTLFQRVSTSTRALGLSQLEALGITESLSKAAVIGGSSFVEAEKGLLQFTQGLARGQLRGDELRSVLEQLPGVADVLAGHFKVTRGELFILGKEGRITGEHIIKAFQDAREEIEQKFLKTTPTISQAFGILRNRITEFFGDVENGSGALTAVSKALLLLADNLNLVARIVVTGLIVSGLTKIRLAIVAIGTAMKVSKITFLITALQTLVALLVTFGDKIKIPGTEIKAFDVLAVAAEDIAKWFKDAAFWIREWVFPDAPPWLRFFFGGSNQGQRPVARPATGLGAVGGTPLGGTAISFGPEARTFTDRVRAHSQLRRAEEEFRRRQLAQAEAGLGEKPTATPSTLDHDSNKRGRKTLADHIRELRDETDLLKLQGIERTNMGRLLKIEHALRERLTGKSRELVKALIAESAALKERNAIRDLRIETGRATELAGLRGDDRAVREAQFALADTLDVDTLTAAQGAIVEGLTRQRVESERYNQILVQITGDQKKFSQELATTADLYRDGKIDLEQYTRQVDKLRLAQLGAATDVKSGLERGLINIRLEATDLAALAEDGLVGAFEAAGDALGDFVAKGKVDFDSLISSMISALTKLAIQQAILGPLAGALGGFFGPASTTASPSSLGLPTDFTTISNPPLSFPTGPAPVARAPQVSVTMENHGTEAEVTQTGTGPDGEALLRIVTRKVTGEIIEDTNRGGGVRSLFEQRGIRTQGVHR